VTSRSQNLVAVSRRLVRALDRNVDVLGLLFAELGELGTNLAEVEHGNLFVQVLREHVHLLFILARLAFVPELKLSDGLVSEGARHDEGRVTGGAAKVEEAAFGEHDDTMAIRELEAVALRLDVLALDARVVFEASHVNFVVEVTDVTNNGVVLHLGHVFNHDNVLVTGGGDEDVALVDDVFNRGNLVTFHGSLEGANRVNFGHNHASTGRLERGGGTLTDVTVAGNPARLGRNHDVSGAHDTIRERVAATVEVVELALGDGVIDVDSREQEFASLLHFIETLDTSGGLFGDTDAGLDNLVPALRVGLQVVGDDLQHALHFGVVSGSRVRNGTVLFELDFSLVTLVDEEGGISTIIDDDVERLVAPVEHLVGAPPVLFERLTLPGEDSRRVASDSRGGVVLRGEDVARAPAHVGTERNEGFNEHRGLDGHVEGTRNVGALERLRRAKLGDAGHQTRHFNLREFNFHATAMSGNDSHSKSLSVSHSNVFFNFDARNRAFDKKSTPPSQFPSSGEKGISRAAGATHSLRIVCPSKLIIRNEFRKNVG